MKVCWRFSAFGSRTGSPGEIPPPHLEPWEKDEGRLEVRRSRHVQFRCNTVGRGTFQTLGEETRGVVLLKVTFATFPMLGVFRPGRRWVHTPSLNLTGMHFRPLRLQSPSSLFVSRSFPDLIAVAMIFTPAEERVLDVLSAKGFDARDLAGLTLEELQDELPTEVPEPILESLRKKVWHLHCKPRMHTWKQLLPSGPCPHISSSASAPARGLLKPTGPHQPTVSSTSTRMLQWLWSRLFSTQA